MDSEIIPDNPGFILNETSQLAVDAKTNRSVILPLWEKIRRFVGVLCKRYYSSEKGSRLYDLDDLMQESYIQFEQAIKDYDPERNNQFSSFLVFYIQKAGRIVSGTRTSKRDASQYAGSLDVPITEDGSITLLDTMVDESSTDTFRAVEDETAVNLILEQVKKLSNPMQRFCFLEHAYREKTYDQIAEGLQTSWQYIYECCDDAAASLRRNPYIKATYPWYYKRPKINCFQNKGLQAFRSSRSSVVEDIVERIVEQQELHDLLYSRKAKKEGRT